jgi:hypothetical protein
MLGRMGFVTGPHVLVRQFNEKLWTLEEQVVYQGRDEIFAIPVGTRTDFASVPRVFAWLVPDFGRYTVAAVLHDYLLAVAVPAGTVDPVDADGLFRRAMRELGVPFLLRWFMWGAVRWGSLTVAARRAGWLREAARTLLVTVVALPIVLVPAVAILLGLGVFTVFEAVTYLLLLGGRWARREPSGTELNPPRPSLTT